MRCDHPAGIDLTDEDARDALAAIAAIAAGSPTRILVDLHALRSVSRDARRRFASSPVPSRIALYVGSAVSRTLANFFINVARPSVPAKVFTDLNDAERWLLDDG